MKPAFTSEPTQVLIFMGVSGSGKTAAGHFFEEKLQWKFLDADDFHPAENIKKMRAGIPLQDVDRALWLMELRSQIKHHLDENIPLVMAASALKASHREVLSREDMRVRFIYLKADIDVIRERLEKRKDHFMPVSLLESQFEALEEPSEKQALILPAFL
ncbi:MAG: gluconokinase, GntK/IdnK-type, partial [Bacteroidota bacterium]